MVGKDRVSETGGKGRGGGKVYEAVDTTEAHQQALVSLLNAPFRLVVATHASPPALPPLPPPPALVCLWGETLARIFVALTTAVVVIQSSETSASLPSLSLVRAGFSSSLSLPLPLELPDPSKLLSSLSSPLWRLGGR